MLVVLTNRGSNLGNATKTCSIALPPSSRLLQKGVAALQDILDFSQVCDNIQTVRCCSWNRQQFSGPGSKRVGECCAAVREALIG